MKIRAPQNMISLSVVAALALTVGSLSAMAETVEIPVGQQGLDKQNIARPPAGMNQDQVKAQFGNPLEWTNPVGDPPITKWIYKDFVVVFEYDQVLHSVLIPTPQPSGNSNSQPANDSNSDNESLNILSKSIN